MIMPLNMEEEVELKTSSWPTASLATVRMVCTAMVATRRLLSATDLTMAGHTSVCAVGQASGTVSSRLVGCNERRVGKGGESYQQSKALRTRRGCACQLGEGELANGRERSSETAREEWLDLWSHICVNLAALLIGNRKDAHLVGEEDVQAGGSSKSLSDLANDLEKVVLILLSR